MPIEKKKQIWAIGGGKGGVGKSLICTNLGIELAQRGNNVILIDGDLGGANLHTCLGLNSHDNSLSDFMNGKINNLNDLLIATRLPNLKLISGAYDVIGIANPKYVQKNKLLRAIEQLDVDYVLIDLGAGTASSVLDFYLLADKSILVVVPEPTSIENAYRFIKSAFYRKLKNVTTHSGVRGLIEHAIEGKSDDAPKTPMELVKKIFTISSTVGEELQEEISKFYPKLIVNQVRSSNDIRIGYSIRSACNKYFGIKLDFVGFVEHDETVLLSVRNRQPFLLGDPATKASKCIRKIADNLINNSQLANIFIK